MDGSRRRASVVANSQPNIKRKASVSVKHGDTLAVSAPVLGRRRGSVATSSGGNQKRRGSNAPRSTLPSVLERSSDGGSDDTELVGTTSQRRRRKRRRSRQQELPPSDLALSAEFNDELLDELGDADLNMSMSRGAAGSAQQPPAEEEKPAHDPDIMPHSLLPNHHNTAQNVQAALQGLIGVCVDQILIRPTIVSTTLRQAAENRPSGPTPIPPDLLLPLQFPSPSPTHGAHADEHQPEHRNAIAPGALAISDRPLSELRRSPSGSDLSSWIITADTPLATLTPHTVTARSAGTRGSRPASAASIGRIPLGSDVFNGTQYSFMDNYTNVTGGLGTGRSGLSAVHSIAPSAITSVAPSVTHSLANSVTTHSAPRSLPRSTATTDPLSEHMPPSSRFDDQRSRNSRTFSGKGPPPAVVGGDPGRGQGGGRIESEVDDGLGGSTMTSSTMRRARQSTSGQNERASRMSRPKSAASLGSRRSVKAENVEPEPASLARQRPGSPSKWIPAKAWDNVPLPPDSMWAYRGADVGRRPPGPSVLAARKRTPSPTRRRSPTHQPATHAFPPRQEFPEDFGAPPQLSIGDWAQVRPSSGNGMLYPMTLASERMAARVALLESTNQARPSTSPAGGGGGTRRDWFPRPPTRGGHQPPNPPQAGPRGEHVLSLAGPTVATDSVPAEQAPSRAKHVYVAADTWREVVGPTLMRIAQNAKGIDV